MNPSKWDTFPLPVRNLQQMKFVKEAQNTVSCSDGRPARIKSMNSLVKLSAAREIYAHRAHQTEGRRQSVLIPLLSSVSNQFSHSWHFWLIVKHGLLPIKKPTLHREPETQAGIRLQTKPHLTTIWNADLKKKNLWIIVCGQIGDCSLDGLAGSKVLWFWIKHSSWSPLCSSHELSSSRTDREWRALPGKISEVKIWQ